MITNEMSNAQAVAAARDYVERKRYRRPPDVIAHPNDYFSEEALLQLADRLEQAEQDAVLGRAVREMPKGMALYHRRDQWGWDAEMRSELVIAGVTRDTPLAALQAAKETQNV